MKKNLLVRGARQLVTLRGPAGPRRGPALRDLAVIEDGALLISGGRITAVGPSRRVENLGEARQAEALDVYGHVVMPGFVDSHTHLVAGPPRLLDYEMRILGADDRRIAEASGGHMASLPALRAAGAAALRDQARRALEAFARHGVTTLEAKSGYGLDEAAEKRTLRVLAALDGDPLDIVPTYFGARAVPPEFAGRADDYIEWMTARMLPRIRKAKWARFVDACCDERAFSCEQARRYLGAARALGFSLKVQAERFSRTGGAWLGAELEAASVDHLVLAGERDADALARSATVATLLPGAAFHPGGGRQAPARMLIDRGAAVALATGYDAASSPTCSMPMMLSLASAQMRMTPSEAISAATINGAHAIRRADRCGSLEYGKDADLLVLNAADYRELPFRFGMNLVRMTIKRGEIIYREGKVLCRGE